MNAHKPIALQVRTVDLRAAEGRISTPDGMSLYVWAFATVGSPPRLPGPPLILNQGETVIVNLTNDLPEPVSIRFPGQAGVMVQNPGGTWEQVRPQYEGGKLVSLTNAAPPGGTITYRFLAAEPGTYLYESGTNPHRQVPLGLHGVIVVRPADYDPEASRTAYGVGTGTEFDREYLLVCGEIDPDQHRAAELGLPYDLRLRHARYWTLNGRCAPDTMLPDHVPYLPTQPQGAMIQAEPGEKVLLRYVGAGLGSYPLHPHGNHTRVVARDGRLLRNGTSDLSYKRFTVLLKSGQTYDMVFEWTGLGFTPTNPIPTLMPRLRNLVIGSQRGWTMWSGSPYLGVKGDLPVGVTDYNEVGEYHFMLHSHSEVQITNWGEFPGGLMTMIAIHPPGTLAPEVGLLA